MLAHPALAAPAPRPGVAALGRPDAADPLPAGDLDARLLPWDTLRRLCLLAGLQPPADQPLSRRELATLLASIAAAGVEPITTATLAARCCGEAGSGPWTAARLLAGTSDRGLLQPGEAGLAWAPGWNFAAEAGGQAARGPWWTAVTVRVQARPGWGAGPAPGDGSSLLDRPGWDPATGPAQQRRAQMLDDGGDLDLVRGVVGREAGGWSVALGWEPRRHGPGLGAALLVDRDAPPFAALTVRRTRPWRWPGLLRTLGPQSLLARAGRLSERPVGFADGSPELPTDHPWFFQWLVRWRVTDWARLGFTHVAVAAPRSGTLWPDLLRINFPPPGVTWDELDDGPYTDRLFAAQIELRWRDAPWRWLPAAAGRAWWEYAGEDFLPRGPWGLLPEIAAPASVAGIELVGPRWDVAVEYAETLHPLVLWYANSSFPSGYQHEGWLLGSSLGGAGERVSGLARRRIGDVVEVELGLERAEWGAEGRTPGLARERHVWLAASPLSGGVPGPWRARLDWRRSEVLEPDRSDRRRWWSISVSRGF